MERGQDIVLGLGSIALGGAAAWAAAAYSGATGGYPLALGLILAASGGGILLRALVAPRNRARPLLDAPGNFFIAVAASGIYGALIVPLGFYSASVLLMLCLPPALGFRRPVFTLCAAFVFTASIWAVFTLVLEKPLPAELWSPARFGGG